LHNQGSISGGCNPALLGLVDCLFSRLWDGHLCHRRVVGFDISCPQSGTNWDVISTETETFEEMIDLPVFVKVKKIDANGMSSSNVATVPNLHSESASMHEETEVAKKEYRTLKRVERSGIKVCRI
jgi:hypothetical protein